MLITILSTFILYQVDLILDKFKINGRYYFNHFIINSIITYYSYYDVYLSYKNINNHFNVPQNTIPIEYAYSIHFYHILMYYNKFLFDDWLHHIVMILFALPFGCYVKTGPIMGHSLFFLTGLPGGINYLLLFLQRNNLIEKKTQKYYNYHLNLLIRQPGAIATSTLSIILALNNYYTFYEKFMVFFIIVSHYWNGIYFMEQVLRNYNKLYITI